MFENCFFSHHLFPVFYGSGFTRTLCGGKWESLKTTSYLESTGRLGCCSPGTFMNSSTSTVCDACPSGQYSTVQNDDTSCNDCSAGAYSVVGATSCAYTATNCPTGTYADDTASCTSCGTGKYGNQTGQSSESIGCKNCVAGKYGNQPGQSSESIACKDCGTGKYNEQVGRSVCKNCGMDKTTLTTNSITASDCKTGTAFRQEGIDSASAEQLRIAYNNLNKCT